jgi:hypothetical protein
MPVFRGGEAVADYLLSQGIRYIMYAYGKEGASEERGFINRLKHDNFIFVKNLALLTLQFHDDLDEVGVTRKRIYDDGEIFVVDLYTKASNINR